MTVRIEGEAFPVIGEPVDVTVPDDAELEEPSGEDPWRVMRRQQDRRRYVRMLVPRRPGREKARRPDPATGVPRDGHPLLAAPSSVIRGAGYLPDAADVRAYMRHSADITMHGGTASAVTYPLAVCSLAEHYLFRRIGGSSAGALVAAATAAAELGRAAPDGEAPVEGSLTVTPGFAGLAAITAWLAGGEGDDVPEQWRLARLLQPSATTRPLFRMLTVILRTPGGSAVRLVRRSLLAAITASGPLARAAVLGSGVALLLGWAGITVALARAAAANDLAGWLVGLTSAVLLVIAACGGAAIATGVAVGSVVRLVTRRADAEHFGIVPGVPVGEGTRTPVSTLLDAASGVPAGTGEVPPLFTWAADRLDDLAGVPGAGEAGRRPLTYGDLWLGRPGTGPGDLVALRRASGSVQHRVVDLAVSTTDIAQRRPYRMPFASLEASEASGSGRFFFCVTCLGGLLPPRVVAHMVATSPARDVDHPCTRHGEGREALHEMPEPWDVPVAFGVRAAFSPPGLMRALPLVAVEDSGEGTRARLHWFSDGTITGESSTADFDVLLPRWPTFGLTMSRAGEPGEDAVRLPAQDATSRRRPWRPVDGVRTFAAALLDTSLGWRDAVQAQTPGYRGRIADVRRIAADGPSFFLSQPAVLRSAMRGYAAGEALRLRFTGSDDGVPGQSQTDRYRWIRLRMALREYRSLSLELNARLPLFSSLASSYHVPESLTPWFDPPLPAATRDPLGADAAAILTTLRSMSAGGVMTSDVDRGAPPSGSGLRLSPGD